MSLGHINLIIHEVQKEHSMELSDASKRHIERLVMSAVQSETEELRLSRDDWRQSDLSNRFPPVTYIHKRKIRIRYICKQCAFIK